MLSWSQLPPAVGSLRFTASHRAACSQHSSWPYFIHPDTLSRRGMAVRLPLPYSCNSRRCVCSPFAPPLASIIAEVGQFRSKKCLPENPTPERLTHVQQYIQSVTFQSIDDSSMRRIDTAGLMVVTSLVPPHAQPCHFQSHGSDVGVNRLDSYLDCTPPY
jgi:hypothetical protein